RSLPTLNLCPHPSSNRHQTPPHIKLLLRRVLDQIKRVEGLLPREKLGLRWRGRLISFMRRGLKTSMQREREGL
ncbi:MAG: hypothetical protein M1835_003073, partial [Candelina submexicana]